MRGVTRWRGFGPQPHKFGSGGGCCCVLLRFVAVSVLTYTHTVRLLAFLQAGIQADVAIYNRIIQAFGKQGEAGLGFMALTKDDMEAAGLKPNQGTFNALLDAYTVAGDAVAVANTKTEMALAKEKGWFAQDVYGLAGEEWEAGIPRK